MGVHKAVQLAFSNKTTLRVVTRRQQHSTKTQLWTRHRHSIGTPIGLYIPNFLQHPLPSAPRDEVDAA